MLNTYVYTYREKNFIETEFTYHITHPFKLYHYLVL